MSEQQTETPQIEQMPAKSPAPKSTAAGVGLAKSLAFIALILVIVAGLFGYEQFMRLQTQLDEQQAQLNDLSGHKAFLDFKQFVSGKFDSLTDQYHLTQGEMKTLSESVSQAVANAARDQRGWVLAETRYLMNMANSRLRLLRDINSATEALKGADQRLATLNDPAFFPVRELLANEITALQTLNQADANGIALKLMSLSKSISDLPPAKIIRTEEQEILAADGLEGNDVIAKLARWIGLRKANRPLMTLPDRDEIFYLDQLLRLELEAARHAALRFDETTYSHHIDAALKLLSQHYDQDNAAVNNVKNELIAIRGRAVFPSLPDISGSSVALTKAEARYNPVAKTDSQDLAL